VTLAVGRHTRLPRTYRGKDIMYWLDRMGLLDESIDDVSDLKSSRNQPSLQLVGRPDRTPLDLPALQESGVRLVGRAVAVDGRRIRFADDLDVYTDAADRKLARLLERIDDHISLSGMTEVSCDVGPRMPFVPMPAPTELDLRLAGIRTVIWATGFRGSYPWLEVPVLDERGEIRHDGGITPAPGLYVLGLRFLRRRKSTFIDGVGDDARDLAAHIAVRLAHRETRAA
jgi:putative flavoprotein involved in K+ transport